MRRRVYPASALVAAAALWLAGSALATPPVTLVTTDYSAALLGKVADTELDLSFDQAAAAPAKATIYVPTGFTTNLASAPGAKVGQFTGTIIVPSVSATNPLPVSGSIVAADPANYSSDPQTKACAPGPHAAVWLISVSAGGQTITIPLYADPASGAESTLGAYRLQACFASPYIPESKGGTPLGIRLVEADLDFPAVFVHPAQVGTYVWRALVTPFTPGTGLANVAGTVEVRSRDPIPHRLTLAAKWSKGKFRISGRLTEIGAPIAGSSIIVVRTEHPSANPNFIHPVGVATTNSGGVFSLLRKLVRTTFLVALSNPVDEACPAPSPAPAGCVDQTTAPAFGVVRATVPKKH